MRVVLDTNVVTAALRSARGASRQLLLAALNGRYTLLVSVPLMIEHEAVLNRTEHLLAAGLNSREVDDILSAIASLAEPVHLAFLWRPILRDPADEMVLETAVNGNADLLVTFNSRDLRNGARRFAIEVETPAVAWRRVGGM